VKKGDPDCPKGQAYRPNPKQENPVHGPADRRHELEGRDDVFRQSRIQDDHHALPTVRAEYGAELLVFTFSAANDDKTGEVPDLLPGAWRDMARGDGQGDGRADAQAGEREDGEDGTHGEVPLRVDASDV